ncbi:MAG: hypothetical protein HRU38_00015 [Saccharospirillaceae bacterium]|nr:hypothetical protein [Pseudomonadales bacterium]NRB77046.1 hypothetical protein [Saccharospirillaceae bacterium]
MNVKHKFIPELLAGESRIKNAPSVLLDNGQLCIPQHFLTFKHSKESVENLVLDIEYDDRFIVFVGEHQKQVYLQIGIVGVDNYRSDKNSKKIVYGRKWGVESELPTSEIIQTVFLALKKAREHEVRELFRLHDVGNIRAFSTPFNNHQDLPLIVQNAELIGYDDELLSDSQMIQKIKQSLQLISYDEMLLDCIRFENLGAQWLVQLQVFPNLTTSLPELITKQGRVLISFILNKLCKNEFYHQLMSSLISLSDCHVDENFTYKNITRFSRNIDIEKLSKLSKSVRKLNKNEHQEFTKTFVNSNYQVDQSRVPKLTNSKLSVKIRESLVSFDVLGGILPI